MTIYEALSNDHAQVKTLLTQLVNTDEKDTTQAATLIQKVRDLLIPHSRVEEALFYNTIRARDKSGKPLHGFKEHLEAEGLLRMLQGEGALGAPWKSTAEKLKTALEHHIKEEENELFALGHQVIDDSEAKEMAQAFEKLKPQVKKESAFKTSLEMMINLIPPKLMADIKSVFSNEG